MATRRIGLAGLVLIGGIALSCGGCSSVGQDFRYTHWVAGEKTLRFVETGWNSHDGVATGYWAGKLVDYIGDDEDEWGIQLGYNPMWRGAIYASDGSFNYVAVGIRTPDIVEIITYVAIDADDGVLFYDYMNYLGWSRV